MAERKKKKKWTPGQRPGQEPKQMGRVRFRFPATVPEAIGRGVRAIGRRVRGEFRRGRPVKQGQRIATGRRDAGPRKRPPPSEAFRRRELDRELSEMLGRPVGGETARAEAAPPARPRPTAETRPAEQPAIAAPIRKARSAASQRRRERLRMQGFTQAEIDELEP